MKDFCIAGFGTVMLCLAQQRKKRFAQVLPGSLDATFGGGDSFCAGLIFALNSDEYSEPATAIRFAVASSALKHTIPGDYNYTSCIEVVNLMKGSASGRVQR